jgi:hypothetical protein
MVGRDLLTEEADAAGPIIHGSTYPAIELVLLVIMDYYTCGSPLHETSEGNCSGGDDEDGGGRVLREAAGTSVNR